MMMELNILQYIEFTTANVMNRAFWFLVFLMRYRLKVT